jgi:hypothetical protein
MEYTSGHVYKAMDLNAETDSDWASDMTDF